MTSNLLHYGVVRANVKGRLVYVVLFLGTRKLKCDGDLFTGLRKSKNIHFPKFPYGFSF